MKIHFRLPLGIEGWDKHLEMPAVPRQGDTVDFGGGDTTDSYTVRTVVWYPNATDFDAYVVLTP